MNIAVVSDDEKTIASHFGHAKGFAIYRLENDRLEKVEYRPNTFTGHARGLAGKDHGIDRHGPILEALKDCQVVISGGMGRRIYKDLSETGIEVLVTQEKDIQSALERYLKGELDNHEDLRCDHHGHHH